MTQHNDMCTLYVMKALYMNGSTHELSLLDVVPSTKQYREGITGYAQSGDMMSLAVSPREFGTIDENLALDGRAGFIRVLTDTEALEFIRKHQASLAERAAQRAGHPPPSEIAQGLRCHSCGFPRIGNAECPHCGDDTRAYERFNPCDRVAHQRPARRPL